MSRLKNIDIGGFKFRLFKVKKLWGAKSADQDYNPLKPTSFVFKPRYKTRLEAFKALIKRRKEAKKGFYHR